MNLTKPAFTVNDVISFDPNQYGLINRVQLMRAYNPGADELYDRVKSMKFFNRDQKELLEEVQSLTSEELQTVGQLLNLFRI
ncbi:MAG TPA: hypothetical protein V6C97_11885 [Oculatellaceae cyanobacterium]